MTGERRNAAWPWILVPLIALALWFGLRSCQQQEEEPSQSAAVTGL